jgi:hypothetical protein
MKSQEQKIKIDYYYDWVTISIDNEECFGDHSFDEYDLRDLLRKLGFVVKTKTHKSED